MEKFTKVIYIYIYIYICIRTRLSLVENLSTKRIMVSPICNCLLLCGILNDGKPHGSPRLSMKP